MSSAHVYVRLQKGQTIDGISEGLLEDCVQLVKANSIQGFFFNSINSFFCKCDNLNMFDNKLHSFFVLIIM